MMVTKKILKGLFVVLVLAFIFVNMLFLNVVLHEVGHYIAADYYELKPEMKLDFSEIRNAGFNLKSIPLASTSFIDNGNEGELAVVALMGPFVNLLLGALFVFVFVFWREKGWFIGEIGLIGMVVSFGSFIMNMLPMNGVDGSLIFGVLF